MFQNISNFGEIIIKYAICSLVHSKPTLLNKIVTKIKSHNVEIFIHLDAKCDITDYSEIKDATFIKNRVNVYWGGRSMVVAMYNLIEYVVKNSNCDYILFISGEDFPIILPDKYHQFIDRSKCYIEYESLPRKDWYKGGVDRVSNFYIFNSPSSILSRAFVKLQKVINFERKYWNTTFKIYCGSQWININRKSAEYILNEWERYYDFFKNCRIPDEFIFQTILLNSPHKDKIVNTNLRFLYFEKNKLSPVYLDESYYADIISSKTLFCRKIFDESSYEKIDTFCKLNGL
jgi:hypothetical protein